MPRNVRGVQSEGSGPILYRAARMTDTDFPCGLVADDHRAGADDTEFTDGDAWTNEDIGADPGVLANDDWASNQWHIPAEEVVRSRAKMAVLADVGAAPERDVTKIIDRDVAADHRARLKCQTPWISDAHSGKHHDFRRHGDIGAEQPEQPCSKAMEWTRTPTKHGRLDKRPQPSHQHLASRIGRDAILSEKRWLLRHAARITKVTEGSRQRRKIASEGCAGFAFAAQGGHSRRPDGH